MWCSLFPMTSQCFVTFRGLKEQVILKVVEPRQINYIRTQDTILKGVSHDSEKFLSDFPPPPCLPLKLSSVACVSLLFTCNCAQVAVALPAVFLLHPALCRQYSWPQTTDRNLSSHQLPSLPTHAVPLLQPIM